MQGAIKRLIRSQGNEYIVRNAEAPTGDRETPSYSEAGVVTGVLEQRRMPRVETLSSGEEVETTLEIRVVTDADSPDLVGAGQTEFPSLLEHPDGQTYRVVASFPEDSGVTVLTVDRA